MRVVLLDDIQNVGEAGTIAVVKNGYARNYLIPRGLAEMATADAINRVELIRRGAEAKRAKRRSEAAGKFQQLDGQSVTITVKAGTAGRIFGSITSALIVEEVRRQLGVVLDRRHVMLEEPLRHLGEFKVPLRAAADVTGELKVLVEPEGPRGRGRTSMYGAGGPTTPEPAAKTAADDTAATDDSAADGTPEGAEAAQGDAEADATAAETGGDATDAAPAESAPEPYEEHDPDTVG